MSLLILFASNEKTVTYSRTIAFTRTSTAGVEDRVSYSKTPTYTRVLTGTVGVATATNVSYSRTIAFTRSSILGVSIAARYERAISFSRTYTAGVASRAFYSAALDFGSRVFELVISTITYWTTPRLSKKKADNYKNFFRGRR